jgi:hypothetical protein
VHLAILPGGEPQDDEPHPRPAGPGDELVDEPEVVASGLGLEQLPVDGRLGGVGAEGLHALEEPGEGRRVRGARVVGLGAQDQEGLPVDEEADAALRPVQAGNRSLGRGVDGGSGENGEEDDE